MGINSDIIKFLIASLTVLLLGVVYVLGRPYLERIRFCSIEKEVTKYFTNEGYEWKKEEGVLNVKRAGNNFKIFLRGEEGVNCTSMWIQYATKFDEDLDVMHWAGQMVMVNVLNDRHPSLNVSMNIEEHILWVHFRADIRSQKEFIFHFNGAYGEMQSLMSDYSELLPKLQADFPTKNKGKSPIGFS
ncbi:MAG: hypothetical protein IJT12_05710 [Paludibacteraceae bacterium]|nr:hypothetical protein [Paludibacteraceae bacterium]